VSEHHIPEQEPMQDLVAAEPDVTESASAEWVDRYRGLIAMMERQLEETRTFAQSVPAPMQEYLSRENIAILEEEIDAFRKRLAYWSTSDEPES
jgi:hypothetical protein